MNLVAVIIFLAFVAATLAITAWAARRLTSRSDFYTAGGTVSGWQNGLAFAGDFLSAAALLGVTGLYFSAGLDGLIYGLGALIGWPALLFLMSDRLRRLGRFTLTDVLSTRLSERPVRLFAGCANLIVLMFYMIAQMVGGGLLIELLFGVDFAVSTAAVGLLMTVYVVFGGMVATTWVQIVKATILIAAAMLLGAMVLSRFGFSLDQLFETAMRKHPLGERLMAPGGLISGPGAAISLGLTLLFGPAGLPHILMRFFTVPNAAEARKSAFLATVLIGGFTLLMIVIGYGSVALVWGDPTYQALDGTLKGGSNLAALHLAHAVGGDALLGVIAAVAFATILAVVSGVTLAAAATVSHDLYASVIRKGQQSEREEILVSRAAAVVFAVTGIVLSYAFREQNINFISVFAFSIAASATFPLLALCLFWKGLNTPGAIAGGSAGLVSAVVALVLGPSVWVAVLGAAEPIFPYQYPTILSMPLAFATAIAVSKFTAPRRRGSGDVSLEERG